MKSVLKVIMQWFGLVSLAKRARLMVARCQSYNHWQTTRNQKTICLELGSGAKRGENGWTTIDLTGADISHDLRNGIPFLTGSVDRIYTSHMLEHIPYRDLVAFLNECYRVLKEGGELSVCVPDASRYIRAYVEGKHFRKFDKMYEPAAVDTGSLLDQVNYIAYMNQLHKYMFDEENLIGTLKKVPFSSVALREFDGTIDLRCRHYESIYAVALK